MSEFKKIELMRYGDLMAGDSCLPSGKLIRIWREPYAGAVLIDADEATALRDWLNKALGEAP